MNKKIQLALLISFFSIVNLYAQRDFRNGFIITLEHDTIWCELNYRSNLKNHESCISRKNHIETEYYPNQILGFRYNDDKYFSSQINEGFFVEVLVEGPISLYSYKNKYYLKKDTTLYDLESKPERVQVGEIFAEKESHQWRGIISYLISDCLGVSIPASSIRLNEKNLTQLIVKYNKCSDQEFIEYKVSKPWTKFEYGAIIGISNSIINIDDNPHYLPYLNKPYSTISPSIGGLIIFSSPRMYERLTLQGEVHFMKSSYSSFVTYEGYTTQYYDIFIDLNTLSVPLSIKYSFPEKRVGFYVQAGLNSDYHLNSKARLLTEIVRENVVETYSESTAFEINKSQIGYWGGLGIFKSYDKFKVSLALRYIHMPSFSKTSDYTANNKRVSIHLILLKK